MVPNVLPPKDFLNKLRTISTNREVWKRAPLFLSVVLLLVMGASFIFSASKTGNVEIATTPISNEDVSGLTAYQRNFSDDNGNLNFSVYWGLTRLSQNIKGSVSADTGFGYGACPSNDAILPFNVFLPGRGQIDSITGRPLLGVEIDPISNKQTWRFDDVLGVNSDNVPSIQRINKEMLNLVFGGDNSGYNGVVFGNDTNPPVITVLRFQYDMYGKAFYHPDSDLRIFNINSATNTGYYAGTNGAPTQVLINPTVWEHRPRSDHGCDDDRKFINDVGALMLWEYHAYETIGIPVNNPNASPHWGVPPESVSKPYPGGGLLHDVHLVKTGNSVGDYKFITTIVNWGIFEFAPAGGSNLSTTWSYKMPTYCEQWSMIDLGNTGTTCTSGDPPRTKIIDSYGFRRELNGNLVERPDLSTTWYAQPVSSRADGIWDANGQLLISVGPWRSYTGNENNPDTNPNGLGYKLHSISVDFPTLGLHRDFNSPPYYSSNNGEASDWKVSQSEVRRIQRTGGTSGTQVGAINPNAGQSNRPMYGGNITVVDNDLNYINTNYFEVGGSTFMCAIRPPLDTGHESLRLENWPGVYNICWPNPQSQFLSTNGPEIWNNDNHTINLKDLTLGGNHLPSAYSETMYKLPNGDFFINGGGNHASWGGNDGGGWPAIIKPSTGEIKWLGNIAGTGWPTGYTHMGAGTYASYGSERDVGYFDNKNLFTYKSDGTINEDNPGLLEHRDGGLASQLCQPPPNNSWVRDFELIRLNGDNHKNPSNPVPGANTKIAYALAGEDGKVFKTYDDNIVQNGDMRPVMQDLIKTGHLENYQNIWLQSFMWGDTGYNYNKFQTSDTPILHYWGLKYTDKTAVLSIAKDGQSGYKVDPGDYTNYDDNAGSSNFYTKKQAGHELEPMMARYRMKATNSSQDSWPANVTKITDKIDNDNTSTFAKSTFFTTNASNPAPPGYQANQVGYKITPKDPVVQPLKVYAKSKWVGSPVHPILSVRVDGVEYYGDQILCNTADWREITVNTPFPVTTKNCVDVLFLNNDNGNEMWVQKVVVDNGFGDGTTTTFYPSNNNNIIYDKAIMDPGDLQNPGDAAYNGKDVVSGSSLQVSGNPDDGVHLVDPGCLRLPGKTRITVRAAGSGQGAGTSGTCWPSMKVGVNVNGTTPDTGYLNRTAATNPVMVNFADYRSYIYYNSAVSNNDQVSVLCNSVDPCSAWGISSHLFVDYIAIGGDVNEDTNTLVGNAHQITSSDCNLTYDTVGANGCANYSYYFDALDLMYPTGCAKSPVWSPPQPEMSVCGAIRFSEYNALGPPVQKPQKPYTPIPDANVTVTGATPYTIPNPTDPNGPGLSTNIGGTINITIPNVVVNPEDIIEIAYTTTVLKAGLMKNQATMTFNNVGNSNSTTSTSNVCVGNAPYLSTSSGDVYLGGGVSPYFAYGNATFLIQSKGGLTNFNSRKSGWVQNNYPLAENLQLGGTKGVSNTLQTNMEKLATDGKLINLSDIGYPDPNGAWIWYLDLNKLGQDQYRNKSGVLVDIWFLWLYIKGKIPANMGAKTIYVRNAYGVYVEDNIYYESSSAPDINSLASLGMVIPNSNLYVGTNVTEMDGAYFVNGAPGGYLNQPTGNINTCYPLSASGCINQLKTQGLWVAKSFSLNRSYVGGNADPAEKVIYDGRVVLNPPPGFADLSNIMSIWHEVAP